MAKKDIVALLFSLFSPVITEAGLELCDIEFEKEGQNWVLRVFIDKNNGVTIDDCELISRQIELLLDKSDPIEQAYILEVSSPGLDRPLKKDADFDKYTGTLVDIKLYKARDKCKLFQGTLIGLVDGVVTIDDDQLGMITFERAEIASCKLAVVF